MAKSNRKSTSSTHGHRGDEVQLHLVRRVASSRLILHFFGLVSTEKRRLVVRDQQSLEYQTTNVYDLRAQRRVSLRGVTDV